MEIERKFLPGTLPENLEDFPHTEIEQAYLNRKPVIRIRRAGGRYILTVKGGGMLAREEYELPMDEEAWNHLLKKTDGRIIRKTRYRIPYGSYTIELDLFHGEYEGLRLAEVEFPSLPEAESFVPPEWFSSDVTEDPRYSNSFMAYEGTDRS